ncbi:unnamed protein product [Paramecium octaurelia]|uniref:Uncharacterized protein n=1 Tax=Paramecium octaurelia TaxID=43137 RepID=A0A8S1S5D6_PAROT|nr:unnamed protein product [Paramecium octaurelia]
MNQRSLFTLLQVQDPKILLFNVKLNLNCHLRRSCLKQQMKYTQKQEAQFQSYPFYIKLKAQLGNDLELQLNDSRSLIDLGFTNNCTLQMREKQTQQKVFNTRIYKVHVELKVKKIELFIEQFQTTPISCVFHDILVQLFQNPQLKIARPLAFFIDGTEIQPYDLRQIQEFQTGKGIIVKSIDPNEVPNQNSIEKFQFAMYQSKEIKHYLKKQIKIQLDDDMEMYDYNDIPLDELVQKHVKIKLRQYFKQSYFINDEIIIFELENIYALNDFKLDIQQFDESQQINYYFIGDFYKKYQIHSIIDKNNYYFEKYLPIDTSNTGLQKYINHQIFGLNQHNYQKEFIFKEDQFVLKYSKI